MYETSQVTYSATVLGVTLTVPSGRLYYGGTHAGDIRLKFRLMQCMLDRSLGPNGTIERERNGQAFSEI